MKNDPYLCKLGDSVVDEVSGFKGVAVSRIIKKYGVNEIGIQPLAVDDKIPNVQWVEESRIVEDKEIKMGIGAQNENGI